jgi:hypothetical protein
MSAVPSGPDASHPTRILGAGWDAGCPAPPELWGAERADLVVNLTDASHLEVACLEITDRATCIEFHNPGDLSCGGCTIRCERDTPPFGDWAAVGLHAEDSSDVRLADLWIHGLAAIGVHAGRLTDWTVERVRVNGNGAAGWDGDLWDGGDDANHGELVFTEVEIAWNGCGEDWQTDLPVVSSCWGQTAGGYGDGFAPGAGGGHWLFTDLDVHHNTSDGLDLLYLDGAAVTEVRRLKAWSNCGNPLKVSGTLVVQDSELVADCAFFDGLAPLVDHCRAGGNALAVNLHASSQVEVRHLTVTGEGDCLVEIGCEAGGCNGSESVLLANTLFLGNVDFFQPWENTCLYWWDDGALPSDPASFDHVLVWDAKDDPCPIGVNPVCADPQVVAPALDGFDGHLLPASPAVDAGNPVYGTSRDLDRLWRDLQPDIGAYERGGAIFRDSFESGATTGWSASVGSS